MPSAHTSHFVQLADTLPKVISTLHLQTPERRLTASHEVLQVMGPLGKPIWQAHISQIDRIDIGPQVGFDDGAMRLASHYGVPVHLVDGNGASSSILEPALTGRAERQLAQAAVRLDPELRLGLARQLVYGRVYNARALLQRWRMNKVKAAKKAVDAEAKALATSQAEAIEAKLKQMFSLRNRCLNATSLDELLGLEGQAAKLFWQLMDQLITGWRMGRRQRDPAHTAVNAVLNLLSHLLTRDMHTLLLHQGLHPGFGVLHSERQTDHLALALDLMEEFRAPVVESLALSLFNQGQLQKTDFRQYRPEGEDKRVSLTRHGTQMVIRAYEVHVTRPAIKLSKGRGKRSWRQVMLSQVRAYVAHIEGRTPYEAYKMDI
jgi:CRISPR-associated protein Cas1